MRRVYERIVWWWYRLTRRDVVPWLVVLAHRRTTIYVPSGSYYIRSSAYLPITIQGDMHGSTMFIYPRSALTAPLAPADTHDPN